MRRILLTTALMFAIGIAIIPSSNAQDCDIPNVVKDLVKKLNDECKKLEGEDAKTSTCTKKQARLVKMVEKWNSLVGNSSLRIGPREMEFGIEQTGSLLTPGDRRFVSQIIEPGKGVTVNVTKRAASIGDDDTKGGCVVNICAVDLDTGAESKLATHTFEGNASIGTQMNKSFSSSQVGNKVLIVRLDGKGVGKRFPYSFKATKN